MKQNLPGLMILGAALLAGLIPLTAWSGNRAVEHPQVRPPSRLDRDTLQRRSLKKLPENERSLPAKEVRPRPSLKPDLVVASVQLTRSCRLRVTIQNRGPGGLPEAAYHPSKGIVVQATSNGAGLGGYRLFAVDRHKRLRKPGTTVSYEGFTKGLETGESLSLKVEILDPNNVLDELNERNNVRTRHLACAKDLDKPLRSVQAKPYLKEEESQRPRLRPDLTIKMMHFEPANPRTSDTIRFSAMLTNVGHRAAPRSEARIRIDKEANPGSISKPVLTPNSSTAITRTLKVEEPGKHRVFFMADVNKDVSESDETNNVAYLDFTVLDASIQAVQAGEALDRPAPAGIDSRLAGSFSFQIKDEELRRNADPNDTSFTVQLEASKDFDPSTVSLGAIQAVVQLFDGNGLQSQNILSGHIEAVSGNILRWQSPQTEYASLCAPSNQNYCKLHFFLHDSVYAQDGEQLDGDGDGKPGGLYRKTFGIQTVQFDPNP